MEKLPFADTPATRDQDVELLGRLAAAQMHFGNPRTALLFLKLAEFILPGQTATMRMMVDAEHRLRRPQQALEIILDLEAADGDAANDPELLRIKGLVLAMLGEGDAARSVLAR